MAHKKGEGSTSNGRDSISKRLGVKLFGGQFAKAGNIIIRQRGTRYHAGENTYLGVDHTLHAKIDGKVHFSKGKNDRTYVNIVPIEIVNEVLDMPKKAAAPKTQAKSSPKVVQNAITTAKEAAPTVSTITTTKVTQVSSPQPVITRITETIKETATPIVEKVETIVTEVKETIVEAAAPVVEKVETVVTEVKETIVEAAAPVVEKVETVVTEVKETIVEATAPVVEKVETSVTEEKETIEETGAPVGEAETSTYTGKIDDLKIIEGIGPKIETILNEAGVYRFEQLATMPADAVKAILEAAGPRYNIHDPSSWAQQAQLAHNGKWDDLQELQDKLTGGRDLTKD